MNTYFACSDICVCLPGWVVWADITFCLRRYAALSTLTGKQVIQLSDDTGGSSLQNRPLFQWRIGGVETRLAHSQYSPNTELQPGLFSQGKNQSFGFIIDITQLKTSVHEWVLCDPLLHGFRPDRFCFQEGVFKSLFLVLFIWCR